ncbi:MAG: MerR family transcriptional regulator [Proteobacteria bacterium]|nr:MerR family transcriptional regulator [Pseudomonadota bacterium]
MADSSGVKSAGDGKSAQAFRTISEVSGDLDVPQHVLRFWETKFPQVKPMKRGGGRRYYRPDDVALLKRIRDLLYSDGYTIRGVQRLLRENGVRVVLENVRGAPQPGPAEEIPREDLAEKDVVSENAFLPTPIIKTKIDPSGIGLEKRQALESVLSELVTTRAIIQG